MKTTDGRNIKLVLFITVIAIFIIILSFFSGRETEAGKVIFNDGILETTVKSQLGIVGPPRFTEKDMALLTGLDIKSKGIQSLIGLEYAENLKALDLNGNEINDLTPLTGLKALEKLNIESNQLNSINPLADLTKIKYLSLANNQISDINSLAGLNTLQKLSLSSNKVSNITPLMNMVSLQYLELDKNHIKDISALANLDLVYVNLAYNFLELDKGYEAMEVIDALLNKGVRVNYLPQCLTSIADHWAKENIEQLVKRGAIAGYPEDTLRPDHPITRAELIAVIVKLLELEITPGIVYSDTVDHWAEDYISTAAARAIAMGYNERYFGPEDLVTREQIAVMTAKAFKLKEMPGELTFSDEADVADWAKGWVITATENKLMSGYPDNTFRPQAHVTRAEAFTVITNALKYTGPDRPACMWIGNLLY